MKKEEKTFEQMTNEAVRLVNTVLGTRIPLNREEGEYVNMSNALREMEIELDDYRNQVMDYRNQVKRKDAEMARKDAEMKKEMAQKDAEMERLRQEIIMLRGLARA